MIIRTTPTQETTTLFKTYDVLGTQSYLDNLFIFTAGYIFVAYVLIDKITIY